MANGSMEEAQKNYGKVVAKAWSDEDFKAKLMADPKSVLKENGVEVPDDIEIKVVENSDKQVHFILPPKPKEGQLSDEELGRVAGGSWDDDAANAADKAVRHVTGYSLDCGGVCIRK